MTRLIRRVQNLIVENREVQGKAEPDWVCWCEVSLCDLGGILVSLEGQVGRVLALGTEGKFGQITVVVALPISRKKY